MTRTLTLEAAGDEVTDGELHGLIALLTRLHESSDLSRVRVEVEADSGMLEEFAGLNPTANGLEEGTTPVTHVSDASDASDDAEVDGDEEAVGGSLAAEDEGKSEGREEIPEPPVLSSFDDPEEAGEAWIDYHEETGEVPRLNASAKYFRVVTLLHEASDGLTTAEIVAASEETDQQMNQSQVSSHMYNLLQKGVVTREKDDGPYEYRLTDLGEVAYEEASAD